MEQAQRGICYERQPTTWGALAIDQYVVDPSCRLWRIQDIRDGALLVTDGEATKVWAAQDPAKEVPVAEIYPSDPVHLLRSMLGAYVEAYRQNGDGMWTAAPWYPERPGNEPTNAYWSHLAEMHGLRSSEIRKGGLPDMTYDAAYRQHLKLHESNEHHKVPHIHPEVK